MQGGFRIQPGSAAKSAEDSREAEGLSRGPQGFRIGSAAKSAEDAREAEGLSRGPQGFRIESAAKSAEELARENGGRQIQASTGIRISSAAGQKFDLPERPVAQPEPVTPAPQAAVQPPAPAEPAGPSRLMGLFRGWFGRGV